MVKLPDWERRGLKDLLSRRTDYDDIYFGAQGFPTVDKALTRWNRGDRLSAWEANRRGVTQKENLLDKLWSLLR